MSEIVDNGDEPGFIVTCYEDKDHPITISRPTASGAWAEVGKKFFELKKVSFFSIFYFFQEHTGKDTYTQLSGPEMFGFAHPTIAKLIQEMPGAEACTAYQPQQFVPANTKMKISGLDDRKKKKKKLRDEEEDEEDLLESDEYEEDDFSDEEPLQPKMLKVRPEIDVDMKFMTPDKSQMKSSPRSVKTPLSTNNEAPFS